MKKVILLLAFAGLAIVANAQENNEEYGLDYEIPLKKSVINNSFWANWYVFGGADFNAAYTSEEHLGNKNPFSVDRGTFGFNLGIGKWFTPVVGLRTKFQGAWSKQVVNADIHHAYKYWNLHEDFTINLTNMLRGYKENRIWNLVPYIGFGVARNMSAGIYDLSFNCGIQNNFNLSRHLSLFLDVYYNSMDGSFDAAEDDEWASHKRFAMRHADKMLGLSVGITYHIGKSRWTKAPDVDALLAMNSEQLEAMNMSLEEQQQENKRLRQLLSEQKPPEMVVNETQLVSTSHSIFFNLGSSRVANRKDLIDLKDIVAFAKQYVRPILVAGYADSKTGKAEYNQKLSADRANVIADILVKMGLDRKQIKVEAKGGVDDIAPFSYNRRVIVKVQ